MQPIKASISFPTLEAEVLQFWKDNGIEAKALAAHAEARAFVFYDGPPFATGSPHYGNLLAGIIKDVIPRYFSMRGFAVERRWGWDCHGLPVEFEVEKQLGLSGRQDVEKFGIAAFNEACRSRVLEYAAEWEKIVRRTGRWVDFARAYRTMDVDYMDSVWWALAELWKKGLLVEGYRVMPYSWRIGTPLSNFEASLNYQNVQDPSVAVLFRRLGTAEKNKEYFVAWTTTPWTLPVNLGLAIHPQLNYATVENVLGDRFIVAENLIESVFDLKRVEGGVKKTGTIKGTELVGARYEPLFPFYESKAQEGAFRIFASEHVSAEEGTGVVHLAPYGEDDFALFEKNGIAIVDPLNSEGVFQAPVTPYQGLLFRDANRPILQDLKKEKKLLWSETREHSYPFCWRSDTPWIHRTGKGVRSAPPLTPSP